MSPFPSLGELIFKATYLAEQSRTSEITIDILLAALDAPAVDPASVFNLPPAALESGGVSYCVNTDWKSLSPGATKALEPFAGMETIDRDALRKALLEAR